MERQVLARARRNRRLVRADTLESFIGKAQRLRLAVPDMAFRLRELYPCVPSRGAVGTRSNIIGRRFRATPTTRVSHLALKYLQFWQDLPQKLHHRPIWPKELKLTATVHTDVSMSAYGATLSLGEHEAGTRGYYECRGYWEGSHKELGHIAVLELTTVRLALKEFLEYCVMRENKVVKLYTDNMVGMHVVNQWVSKSPAIKAELRRLHQFFKRHGLMLDLHHLPSALNLFADRLSRRRRVVDYLPSFTGVPDHWWVGDSEHGF
jgi:hypothetical protein